MKPDFTFVKKATAVVLSAVFFVLAVLSFLGIVYAAEMEYYTSTHDQLSGDALTEALTEEAYDALERFTHGEDNGELIRYYENTDFRIQIYDQKGTLLFSNLSKEDIIVTSVTREMGKFAGYPEGDGKEPIYSIFEVAAYMIEDGDALFSMQLGFVSFMFAMRFVLIGLVAVFLLGMAVSFVYLLFAAGKHHRDEASRVGPVEKCPFDLYLLVYFVIATIAISILDAIQYSVTDILFFVILGLFAICGYLLLLGFFMSVSIRLKTGTIWKNTLIYIVFSAIFRGLAAFFRMIPVVWKTSIILCLYAFIEFIAALIGYSGGPLLIFLFMKDLVLIPFVILLAYHFRTLKKGAESIKNGNYEKKINSRNMFGEQKSFAETLDTISDGLAGAVDARLKSERMKTELITNVSHDIKTPLTSIINYTDLLKKEEIANETATGYIEVIDRQATRLKKLITDLVEASKASTGNMPVNLERLDIAVLLQQAAGEYDEKFKNADLIPVLRIPSEPIYISADGRLLWRVLDNLMSNICKYSLPQTRVYLDASVYGEMCVLSFKNISRTELDLSPEELLERFVRADHSRSTEGNGLGLSIAQSLVDLQGGTLELFCDGDLFKVRLTFPVIKA